MHTPNPKVEISLAMAAHKITYSDLEIAAMLILPPGSLGVEERISRVGIFFEAYMFYNTSM
jgi:hypothetical protein